MNRKGHCISRKLLVVNADIFHYRQSASKKKEKKKIKKLTNAKTQEQTYTSSFAYFFNIYIIFLFFHN